MLWNSSVNGVVFTKTEKGIIFSITIFNNLTIKGCTLYTLKVNLLDVPYRSFHEHQSCSVFFWHMNKVFCSFWRSFTVLLGFLLIYFGIAFRIEFFKWSLQDVHFLSFCDRGMVHTNQSLWRTTRLCVPLFKRQGTCVTLTSNIICLTDSR